MREVRDVMTIEVHWVPSDMPLERAAQELASHGVTGVPVCAPDGSVIGVLSLSDLAKHHGAAGERQVVHEVITKEVLAIAPDDSVAHAIRVMALERVHRLLVVGHDDQLMGIVTSMDLLRELAGFPRLRRRERVVLGP
jgi:predicted transcriptional regulator